MASYKGHLRGGFVVGIGLVVSAYIFQFTPTTFQDLILLSTSTVLGSLLPDIDHPKSILGRKVPFISAPIYRTFGHRSLTHSILFIITCFFVLNLFDFYSIALGLSIGIISHILLDLLCPGSGVAFLYPFYKKRIQLIPQGLFKPKKRKRKR